MFQNGVKNNLMIPKFLSDENFLKNFFNTFLYAAAMQQSSKDVYKFY